MDANQLERLIKAIQKQNEETIKKLIAEIKQTNNPDSVNQNKTYTNVIKFEPYNSKAE